LKEFTTAAEIAAEDESGEVRPIEFGVDGVLCKAYRPKGAQVAVLMATTGKHSSEQERIAGFINFFVSVLDEDSHSYLVNRLLDRTDSFDLDQVSAITNYLMAEWSGRPTN
jgi:hypothetical protein